MKLYSFSSSPYGIRVHLQIALKELDIEVAPSPWPLRSPEFYEHFPLGKLPVLLLDDGQHIGESWAILEYLEDLSGDRKPLRPTEPLARAQMQMQARYADTHLAADGLFPVFKTLLVPGSGEPEDYMPSLVAQLKKGEQVLAYLPSFDQRDLNLGDVALGPIILYAKEMLARYGKGEFNLSELPTLSAWWEWFQRDATVAKTMETSREAVIGLLDSLTSQ